MTVPKSNRSVLVLLVPVVLAGLLLACERSTPAATPTPFAGSTLLVELRSFAFDPKDLVFKAGRAVEFLLENKDVEHTFTVKDLGIDWSIPGRESRTESFRFTETGRYRLVCKVPGHEASGMVGSLTVIP